MQIFKKLVFITLILCFIVIGVGAYVRLSDAGLGCPDWPGCYGQLGVPNQPEQIENANRLFPDFPVDIAKAWKEMIHRYLATILGILILAVTFFAFWLRSQRLLVSFILALVVFQGLLGMWTVTLLLQPIIVSAHLIGGIFTLSLLLTLYLRLSPVASRLMIVFSNNYWQIRIITIIMLLLVIAQIMLGGWVSSNYAALACSGFPACNGSFNPPADYANGFMLWRKLGLTASGEFLSTNALIAIHWLHRIGALVVSIFSIILLGILYPRHKIWALVFFVILLIQILLGITIILLSLPISLAVLHNLGAVALMATILILNFSITKSKYQFSKY